MNVEQRDAANAKIRKNQNTIDLLTYFPIWEENGKPLSSEEKENIENEVESLNAKLNKTEMHLEKLELLENEFEAELDYAVNQQLQDSARMVPSDHRINFSMSDKSFFELDENNKLIEKEPYLKRIDLDKSRQRYVEIEINSKRCMGIVRGVEEMRNHFYLKFSPFGVSSKDELELIVEFFNNTSRADHKERIKFTGSRVEERFYQRKTLKDKRVIHYGKGSEEKCINLAIGVRNWEDHRIKKQNLEKYQARKREINELLDESDRLRYTPGFSELTDAWEKHQNIIMQMTRLNILYDDDRRYSNREIPETFCPRAATDEQETGSDQTSCDQNENFLMPCRRGRFSQ